MAYVWITYAIEDPVFNFRVIEIYLSLGIIKNVSTLDKYNSMTYIEKKSF